MDVYLADPAFIADKFADDDDTEDIFLDSAGSEGDDDYLPTFSEDDDNDTFLGVSSDEEPEEDRLKSYPVFFSEEQRRTLSELYDGLNAGSDDDALLGLFHEASLALFTTETKDHRHHRLHNPVEGFIISFNLRMDGSFRRPEGIAPNLSILQYWAQYAVLYDGVYVKSPDQTMQQSVRECVFISDVITILKSLIMIYWL